MISEIKLKRTDTTLDLSQKAKRAKEESSTSEDFEHMNDLMKPGSYCEWCGFAVKRGDSPTSTSGFLHMWCCEGKMYS